MVRFALDKLTELLRSLKEVPNIKEVKALRKRLQQEQKKIIKTKPKQVPKAVTTATRSVNLKKYHRYMRLIRDNFPNLSYKQIRKQFSKKRTGQDVSIPDAVWQNPSP